MGRHVGAEEVAEGRGEDRVKGGENHDAEGEGHGAGKEGGGLHYAEGLPTWNVAEGDVDADYAGAEDACWEIVSTKLKGGRRV